ncbi:MAG: hypothetical protein HOH43_24890 [Candidatus Latescibacteria bacterium]|jgi:hypothetical protein|nr:hypothetical protein [Candidatus Latescibacterota bacterium]
MRQVTISVEELTPYRLTDILYHNHHLQEADISAIIERSSETTSLSAISCFEVVASPSSGWTGGPIP